MTIRYFVELCKIQLLRVWDFPWKTEVYLMLLCLPIQGSISTRRKCLLWYWQWQHTTVLIFSLWKPFLAPKRSKISLTWAFRLTRPQKRKWSGLTHKEIIREPFAEFQQNREAREVQQASHFLMHIQHTAKFFFVKGQISKGKRIFCGQYVYFTDKKGSKWRFRNTFMRH